MSLLRKKRRNEDLFPVVPSFSGWVGDFFKNDDFLQDWAAARTVVPSVNIQEKENEFCVEVAAPGMKKDDFKIHVDKGMLIISSESSAESQEENDAYTRKEFSYSSFKRSFWLPENVDAETISANYSDGILKINLPKIELEVNTSAKLIDVK